MMKFSVCMSVYHGDNAEFFRLALVSISNQTLLPDEIVLVVDGPVNNDINKVIDDFTKITIPFRVIRLSHNCGHAIARQTGLDAVNFDYVALMDSDDISEPDRFKNQIEFLYNNPGIDVLGGQIEEFIGNVSNVVGKRVVPLENSEIKEYMKGRCPMNLMTVVFKKSSVLKVGGFVDWFCEEDYYLWIRMALAEMEFSNLPHSLVKVRVGSEMYARRGGMKYFKSEEGIQRYMLQHHLISLPRYLYNVTGRFVIQVLMPNWLRGFVFRTFFRK
jgi:glycosyltransferase involved in cell wall biosynthesis